ncbi:hypothetical protein FHS68_002138 [Dyadobacter arcticus]|uniref:Uncharacterized protein n=1 Tax=Dyadobacter arcticus TaxID=1078754 RepID=A0ABX0UIY7_9BACT|nr:hypothetical protein [Dyadobacter arcticus]
MMKSCIVAILLICTLAPLLHAQDYVSPVKPAQTGKSPGVTVKLLSTNAETKDWPILPEKRRRNPPKVQFI